MRIVAGWALLPVLLLALFAALPVLAQSATGGEKTAAPEPAKTAAPSRPGRANYDVDTGQLSPADVEAARRAAAQPPAASPPKSTDAPRLTAAGLPQRTKGEVDEMVATIADGFRSACCPHQKMADTQCPCHDFQIGMLTFLCEMGFSRDDIRQYMIDGGPKALRLPGTSPGGKPAETVVDLTPVYRNWLATDWIPTLKRGSWGTQSDSYFTLNFEVRGKQQTYGWDHGWSALIEEAPRDWTGYLLVGLAAVVCIGGFITAFIVLGRRATPVHTVAGGGASVTTATVPSAAPTAADEARITADLKALDDDE
jgi:hypothetical protein